jgi:acyl carrier protein
MTHAGLLAMALAQHSTLGVGDVLLQCGSPGTKAFVCELLMTMLNGATLACSDRIGARTSGDLATEANRLDANVILAPLSLAQQSGLENPFLVRKTIVLIDGDPRWTPSPASHLHALFAPLETSLNGLSGNWEPSSGPFPAGGHSSDAPLYVLDEGMNPSPIGAAGELYVGGAVLARGFLNDPAGTAEGFVPDPFSTCPGARMYGTGSFGRWRSDGRMEYLGAIRTAPDPEWMKTASTPSVADERDPDLSMLEEVLGGIWSEVMGREKIGIEDIFFDLGVDSLRAMQVTARVRRAFGVQLPLAALLESETVAALARLLREDRRFEAQTRNVIQVLRSSVSDEAGDSNL